MFLILFLVHNLKQKVKKDYFLLKHFYQHKHVTVIKLLFHVKLHVVHYNKTQSI